MGGIPTEIQNLSWNCSSNEGQDEERLKNNKLPKYMQKRIINNLFNDAKHV